MSQGARNIVKPYLEPGETLVWAGQPALPVILRGGVRRAAAPYISGAGLVLALVLYALVRILIYLLSDDRPDTDVAQAFVYILLIYILLIVGAGIAYFFGMFGLAWLWGRFVRRRTIYAVTSRRLLILRTVPFSRPKRMSLGAAGFTVVPGRGSNSGDVVFVQSKDRPPGTHDVEAMDPELRFSFDNLADISSVQRAFEQAQRLAERDPQMLG